MAGNAEGHREGITPVDEATIEEERSEASMEAAADRAPTPDEADAADAAAADVPDTVAEHYEEMAERGAHVEGEGQIEP